MDCNKSDCVHYKVCEEWKSLGNDNYINESNGNCDCYSAPYNPTGDLISREALKYVTKQLYNETLDGLVKFGIEKVYDLIDNAPTVAARQQGEIKKYKPLEPDYNVQCAVENLRVAYWSNEPEKVAKAFSEAEDIIISAICHHGYTVCKETTDKHDRPQGEWLKFGVVGLKACYRCSICGRYAVDNIENNVTKSYPFCHCGAKMKGGAE